MATVNSQSPQPPQSATMDVVQTASPQATSSGPITTPAEAPKTSAALQKWTRDKTLFIHLYDELLFAIASLDQEPLVFHNNITAHKKFLAYFAAIESEDKISTKIRDEFIAQRVHLGSVLLGRIQQTVDERAHRPCAWFRTVAITPELMEQYRLVREPIGIGKQIEYPEKELELWELLSEEAVKQFTAHYIPASSHKEIKKTKPSTSEKDLLAAATVTTVTETDNRASSNGEEVGIESIAGHNSTNVAPQNNSLVPPPHTATSDSIVGTSAPVAASATVPKKRKRLQPRNPAPKRQTTTIVNSKNPKCKWNASKTPGTTKRCERFLSKPEIIARGICHIHAKLYLKLSEEEKQAVLDFPWEEEAKEEEDVEVGPTEKRVKFEIGGEIYDSAGGD